MNFNNKIKTYAVAFAFIILFTMVTLTVADKALAQTEANKKPVELEPVEVIGVTPVHTLGIPREQVPTNVQVGTSQEIEASQSLDLPEFLERNLGSVHVNDAQNNPFQADLQYRGFTASPLLGLPQGIAVYQDGVRLNEPFGDTVNWDLIPQSAIASINLVPGANPLFGLNALGGALSIKTKTGFAHPGYKIQVYGGSFERIVGTFELGGSNENLGYFVTGTLFDEEGWRDFSPSEVKQLFGNLGWKGEASSLTLSLGFADSKLIGNGATPIDLLEIDREAIFTHPDRTENELFMVNLRGTRQQTDNLIFEGNIYLRRNNIETFNGDDTDFAPCQEEENRGFLCSGVEEEDEDNGNGPEQGEEENEAEDHNGEGGEEEQVVFDQFGNPVLFSDAVGSATNNSSATDQSAVGFSFQAIFLNDVLGRENQLIIGTSLDRGRADFTSQTELARLTPDRGTIGSGLLDSSSFVDVESRDLLFGLYATNTFSVTPELSLTLSGRYNNADIELRDQLGTDLSGDHSFNRFNPAVGAAYQLKPALSLYGTYSESSRAPTPVELTCADPDDPCRLPNAFLADPPLDQVVARTFEAGVRGRVDYTKQQGGLRWNANFFRTKNEDDIIFISAGPLLNQGFFDNIEETRRQGIELNLTGHFSQFRWFFNYTFLDATFETELTIASENHPLAEAGEIEVEPGDRIPGIPRHNLKVGAEYATSKWSLGADLLYNSDQVLRGDEANLLDKVEGYAVVNIRGQYWITNYLKVFARVNNVFDQEYETFGLLGEADEVLGEDFEDPRFLGPGAPRAGWVGVELNLSELL